MSFSGLTPHFISPSCSAQPSPLASLTASTSHEPPLRTTHAETTHTDVSASADAVAPHTAASLDDAALHTIRALIFDLDGTLLDTLPHLTALTNFVLAQQHFPQHTQEEVLSYIGEGGQKTPHACRAKKYPSRRDRCYVSAVERKVLHARNRFSSAF